jgi:hypothetical protein
MVARFNYTPIRNTALSLIKKFGRPCILMRPIEGALSDVNMPWLGGDSPTFDSYPFIGVVSGLPFPKRADPSMDQTEVEITVPGDIAVEPLTTDRLQLIGVLAGETNPIYQIVGVHRVDPSGDTIIYTLRCTAWATLVAAPSSGI